jgi:hypothetical protein
VTFLSEPLLYSSHIPHGDYVLKMACKANIMHRTKLHLKISQICHKVYAFIHTLKYVHTYITKSTYTCISKMYSNVILARFEVFMAVTMKNSVFWDVMPCGSCKNRRFRGTYRFHHQSGKPHGVTSQKMAFLNVILNYIQDWDKAAWEENCKCEHSLFILDILMISLPLPPTSLLVCIESLM